MKWLTNLRRQDLNGNSSILDLPENFLDDKIIGEPKASKVYTVEQLKERDMVGIYIIDED